MNGKKLACVILIMIVAGIAYGTQIMGQRAKAMRDEAETSENERRAASNELEVSKITKDLRNFLKAWEPVAQRIQTGQEAEQLLLSILRDSGILTVSQKFEVKTSQTNLLIPKSLQGTLIVQGEYNKVLNWMGDFERKLPLARITSCRLKQGETGRQANIEIHFDIPMVDLDAKFDDTK
jgi:hypothetical protein